MGQDGHKCSSWRWVSLSKITSVAAGDGSGRSQVSSVAAGDGSGHKCSSWRWVRVVTSVAAGDVSAG